MSSRRIYGIDFGKGLAVAGMLLAHTFEGGVCDWENDIELKYVSMVPLVLKVILAPISVVCMMGLFFTDLTSMTCTMSMLRAEKKGNAAVMSYLTYRLAFAFVLKGVELVMTCWWEDYGIFDKMTIAIPSAEIETFAHTLDSIGVCGFVVPLTVYLVRRIPGWKDRCSHQVVCLTTIGLLLLLVYNYIADFAMIASEWCFQYDFHFLGMLFSKVGSGPFMLAQCIPFGIVSGALSLIFINKKEWKYAWRFFGIVFSVAIVVTVYFFIVTPNPFAEILNERKPVFMRFLELSFEMFACVFVFGFTDNEARPLIKRYHLNKNLTFFRRISCVSLSSFIFEGWVSKQLRKVFAIFVGKPYDATTREVYWNLWTVMIFMLVNYAVDLWILSQWERINFNFSCEHLIANILSYLFGRKEEINWKESNDKIIYGPNKQLEAEILLNSKLGDDMKGKDGKGVPHSDISSKPKSEIEMVSSLIEVKVDLKDN